MLSNISIEITGEMPTHFGFGSNTGIRLGCLEALYLLNDRKVEPENLVIASGRGGTSGIGINTYFIGGFIVDLGRKADLTVHCPSSMTEDRQILPLLLERIDMPNWDVGICIPLTIPNKSEAEERDFFKKTCPISAYKVYKTLYDVIYGLNAAVKEKDRETFSAAIKEIQQDAWKFTERAEYSSLLLELETQLYSNGAIAVGMSSLGPSLYFLADDVLTVVQKMEQDRAKCILLITKPSNSGREVRYV
jgi:beta-ribofuranosylaminobenzene 5'-phosphate synthase